MPQETHETEQRCRLMIESVEDHGIFMLDAAGRIASWNKGAEQILGYTDAEILGQPFARFFPPEAASESEAELQKAAADGRAAVDRWHVRKNGSRFWCSGVVTALRDAHGNSQGFVTVMRDLTHEKQLETALRDAPSYTNAITNTLREPFVVLDKELRVKTASRSFYQWFGVTQEETENQFIFDLGNGQWNKPRLREVLAAVLDNSGVAADFTVQHTFPGIGHRIMSLNASRCFDQTELILLAFADVTAVRLAEDDMRRQADELAANSQRKDEFLAMLSHELRNPLASILSAVELLQCLDADHEAEAQARVTIERQVRHLARMVDDLLEVSRGTTGRVRLDVQQVELRTIVKRSIKAIRHFLDEHRHHLSVSLPPAPLITQADPDRLQQVIVNLLHNAAKYTDAGGKIALSLERQAGQAVLRVRDNGIGIEPELLPNVFTMFLQGDVSLDRSQGGLGIGLSLVRTIVEKHGGTVEACSAGGGLGSEFVVQLPIKSTNTLRFDHAARRSVRGPSAPVRSGGPDRPLRVLMVDDLVDNSKCLAMLLRRSGHDVRIAHSGPAALEAAAEYQPEAVLLDIGLPGMSGFEVARRIRQSPLHQHVRLIALTGYGQESDRQRSREAGFDYHLVKPVGLQTIQEVLTTPGNSGRTNSGELLC